MNKTKLVIIGLLGISLVILAGGYYLLSQEKAKSLTLQSEIDSLKEQQEIYKKKLDESKKLSASLETKLQEAKTQVDKLTIDLAQEKANKQEIQSQLDYVSSDLDKQKGLRSDLEKKLSKTQADAKSLEDKLKDLDAKKKELETKVQDLESQVKKVELGTIVVAPEQSAKSSVKEQASKSKETKKEVKKEVKKEAKKETKAVEPIRPVASLEGKVSVVNVDYNFTVINIGAKDGVNVEDMFAVYSNNKYIGDIKVIKVHDAMSAADFLSADIKDKIAEGDKVVRKNK